MALGGMKMQDDARSRLVMFSGGSACRSINLALSRRPVHLTRVVPSWDSGGSSKILREQFDNFLSIGDIRQALMTMAHGEGCAGEVVKICNSRISDNLGRDEAAHEFAYYAEGRHPMVLEMEPGLRGAILNYLQTFGARIADDFDFRNGSIGNFILTGAYLAHNNDINTAIFVFRKLCGIEGSVWPSSVQNGVDLSAVLHNGKAVEKQHLVTALDPADAASGIGSIALSGADGGGVRANEAVLEAIEQADMIVFGPGSFFSSILPHLLVGGIVAAVERNRGALKVFIGNILQCRETFSLSLSDTVARFDDRWRQNGGTAGAGLTHVLANRELFPFEKTVGSFAYLGNGALLAQAEALGFQAVIGEFEDAWSRGTHDGEAVAGVLTGLLAPSTFVGL
jgi:2-phospho-L-lactate transferase/gluconeogenesis factor (CofD/UPF0052 family)